MSQFSFEFRHSPVLVNYSLSSDWRASWVAIYLWGGHAEFLLEGETQSEDGDSNLEHRITRSVCEKIALLHATRALARGESDDSRWA